MHEVLINRLGGLSLPRKSVVRLTDRPDMTFDVYRGRKITMQQLKGKYRSKFFPFRVDSIRKVFVNQGNKQRVAEVVAL